MAVGVVVVGGTVGDLDGEEGDAGGDEVDAGVSGFGEHAERAGEEAGEELEERDTEGGEDGEERGGTLGVVRGRGLLGRGRLAHGEMLHGTEGEAHRDRSCEFTGATELAAARVTTEVEHDSGAEEHGEAHQTETALVVAGEVFGEAHQVGAEEAAE